MRRVLTVRQVRRLAVLALLATTVLIIGWWQGGSSDVEPADTVAAGQAPAAGTATESEATSPARYDLSADEARGGHTLARHVDRTDDELRERLDRERSISAASTYRDRETAERVVALTLREEAARVDEWRRRSGRRPNLALDYRGREVIGRTLIRGRRAPTPSTNAVVVLRWDDRRGAAIVLTSYPEAR